MVGLTLVEPLADVELKPPGEIEIIVAPFVVQLNVLVASAFMLVGFAAKDEMEGAEPVPWVASGELVVPAQLVNPAQASRMKNSTLRLNPGGLYACGPGRRL